ncbi:MFS transporter [Salinicola aestuarinus]|uniref:MFS transporter n=1 Tax=Salinicola aestuarinus TaxID=1949082 RepID=UPI001FD953F5|nr:MFS transporter [Salinicola aestuarinus]
MAEAVETEVRPSARVALLIELALAVGGFAIGTGEFAIMGLMPDVARGLGVGETQVGHLISAYALGVVVGAPLIAIFGSYLYRRQLLLLLMIFFAVGNFASAIAPEYYSLMAFRFISGLPHGAYFGVAALVAASMVPPHKRAKAVSRVMLGITTAMLVGNPLATWLGQLLDWRYAFGLVGAIGIATVVMVALYLPVNRQEVRSKPLTELAALGRRQVWLTLGIGAIGFAGMFSVFSYLAPTLINVTGIAEHWVPLVLAAFGIGAIAGNIIGGWLFDKLQFRSVGWILGFSALILFLFPLAANSVWSVVLSVMTVGSMVALSPALQIRLMDVAKDAQTMAAASNHAAFNVANALGPWLGGMAITAGFGWTSTGYVGTAMALGGLLIYWWARWLEPKAKK